MATIYAVRPHFLAAYISIVFWTGSAAAEPKANNDELFKSIITGMGYDTKGTKGNIDVNTMKALDLYRLDHEKATGEKLTKKNSISVLLGNAVNCIFPKDEEKVEKSEKERYDNYCNNVAKLQKRNSDENILLAAKPVLLTVNNALEKCNAKRVMTEKEFVSLMSLAIKRARIMNWNAGYIVTDLTFADRLKEMMPGGNISFCEFLSKFDQAQSDIADTIMYGMINTALRAAKMKMLVF